MDHTSVNYGPVRPGSRAAACWWASRLGRCHHVTGSMRTVSGVQANIAENLVTQTGYDDDQRDRFAAELEQLIDALTPGPWHGDSVVVRVDWDPDKTLDAAATRAGLNLACGLGRHDLPLKTTMLIEPGRIRVKEGYGAAYVEIWQDGELTADAAVEGITTIP
jgi:hypothetical protein